MKLQTLGLLAVKLGCVVLSNAFLWLWVLTAMAAPHGPRTPPYLEHEWYLLGLLVPLTGLAWVSRTNRIPWGTLALLYVSPCFSLAQGGSINILVLALFGGLYALSAVYTAWAMTVFRKLA